MSEPEAVDECKAARERPKADHLIEVAGQIFAEKGPNATVREICSAASCSVASVNYYFGDKHQLYVRCVQEALEQKQRLFPLPEITANSQSVADAPNLLRQFLHAVALRVAGKSNLSWHNALMLREVISPSQGVDELLREPFRRDFEKLEHVLSMLLGEQLDTVELRQNLTTQILARCMFLRTGTSLRTMFGLAQGANEDPEQYADVICDSILLQLDALRQTNKLPKLVWTNSNNYAVTQTQIES